MYTTLKSLFANQLMSMSFAAEKFLESVEVNQNYAILLLHLIDKETVDLTIRVAAAIAFKNLIKRNWPVVSISHLEANSCF